MPYLNETHRIEILMMIGYGNRSRKQAEVARLFTEVHPELPSINRSTISKIETRYRELGHVRDAPQQKVLKVDEEAQLNILLEVKENPVTPAR